MTPKKYLQLKILDPKKYHWPPCRFTWGVTPLGQNVYFSVLPVREREMIGTHPSRSESGAEVYRVDRKPGTLPHPLRERS